MINSLNDSCKLEAWFLTQQTFAVVVEQYDFDMFTMKRIYISSWWPSQPVAATVLVYPSVNSI